MNPTEEKIEEALKWADDYAKIDEWHRTCHYACILAAVYREAIRERDDALDRVFLLTGSGEMMGK